MARLAALSVATVLLTGTALAGTDLQLPTFTGIAAHSGAHVILRHGNTQRVTILKGDPSKADLHVSGNTLDISPCRFWCWGVSSFEVEIVSPKIDAIEAHSGGSLTADGGFPKQAALRLNAHSGGAVDTEAIPADAVDAQANSGGSIRLKVLSSLNALAHSGGAISYAGNPPHIVVQSHSGGAISKE